MSEERDKIIVIEDNKEHLMALAIRLRAHGFDVVSAGDGATAMTVVNREKPDAVILDLGLPGGDGFVVLQRLRSLASTVALPVVVVTARPAQTNRALALEQGVVAFLQKPAPTPVWRRPEDRYRQGPQRADYFGQAERQPCRCLLSAQPGDAREKRRLVGIDPRKGAERHGCR